MTTTTPTPTRKQGRAWRWVWRIGGSLLTVWVLGWYVLDFVSLVAREESREVSEWPAVQVQAVDVASDDGTITIVATDTDTVRVTIELVRGLRGPNLKESLNDGLLRLRADCPPQTMWAWCEARYIVEVPADVDVVARSDVSRVSATGMQGSTTLRSQHSTVVLDRVGGTVDARSEHGSITGTDLEASALQAQTFAGNVSLGFAAPPTELHATARYGDVTVTVPNDGSVYAVDIAGDRGRARADVRTDPDAPKSIYLRSGEGDAVVEYR